jgi:hypothetical protein
MCYVKLVYKPIFNLSLTFKNSLKMNFSIWVLMFILLLIGTITYKIIISFDLKETFAFFCTFDNLISVTNIILCILLLEILSLSDGFFLKLIKTSVTILIMLMIIILLFNK